MSKSWFTCPHCGLHLKLNPKLSYTCTRCGHFPMSPGQFIVMQPQQPRMTTPLSPPTASGSVPPPSGGYPPPVVLVVPPPGPNPLRVWAGQGWRWYRQQRRNTQIIMGALAVVVLVACCVASGTYAVQANQSFDATATAQIIAQATANAPTSTPTPGTPTPTRTPKPSPTPTHALAWTTVQTFQGNGNKKTPTFAVPGDWKILWSCDPSSDYFGSYNLIIDVYNADGSYFDLGAINTICKAGNTSDQTEEHQSGTVYLDVQSESAWTVQVQVLK